MKKSKHNRRKKTYPKKRVQSHSYNRILLSASILFILAVSYYLLHENKFIGQAASQLPATHSERLMEADYIIGENGTVSIINLRAFKGPVRDEPKTEEEYQFLIYGRNNQLINKQYFPAYFVIFDPFYRVGEIPVTLTVPYREEYATVDLVRGDKIIYRHDVSALCRQDSICQNRENTISCPADCPSGSADGYCDRIPDDVCDPDCLAGDADCNTIRIPWIFIISTLLVVLAVVALFLKKQRAP